MREEAGGVHERLYRPAVVCVGHQEIGQADRGVAGRGKASEEMNELTIPAIPAISLWQPWAWLLVHGHEHPNGKRGRKLLCFRS